MLPPTHRRLLRHAWVRASYPRGVGKPTDISQSGGGRFTASLRLAEERLIGEPDALLERGRGAPAELGQPADVEQFSRRAVRARGVKADPTGIADGSRDHAGEFSDRDVLAGADIDQFVSGIGLHQMNAGIGKIV